MDSIPPDEKKIFAETDPVTKEAGMRAVRADLLLLLGACHWTYSMMSVRERLRSAISGKLLMRLTTSCLALGALSAASYAYSHFLLMTLLFTVSAGMIGGFVSAQRRLQGSYTRNDPVLSVMGVSEGQSSILLSPLSGAIFSVVLLLMFQAGLLEGGLFPKFVVASTVTSCAAGDWICGIFKAINPTSAKLPDNATSYASLLIWCFVSGFAERFVPDVLDRLVARQEQTLAPASQQNLMRTQPPPPAPSAPTAAPPATVAAPPAPAVQPAAAAAAAAQAPVKQAV